MDLRRNGMLYIHESTGRISIAILHQCFGTTIQHTTGTCACTLPVVITRASSYYLPLYPYSVRLGILQSNKAIPSGAWEPPLRNTLEH